MSIEFEFYETPDASGGENPKYHARAVTRNTVSSEQIIREINEASSLTPGDVKAALTSLSDLLAYHLGSSERVYLEGIGYFQPTLTSSREIDPKKTRAQSVWFKSVKFRADQNLKKKLANVHTIRTELKIHSAKLTNEDIDKRLTRYFQTNNRITRRELESLCSFTRTTAARHMNRLVKEGKIKNIGLRNQPIYIPVPGAYNITNNCIL